MHNSCFNQYYQYRGFSMAVPQDGTSRFSWKVVFDFRGTELSVADIEGRIDRWARILRKDLLKTISSEKRVVYRMGDPVFAKTIASMAGDMGCRVSITKNDAWADSGHKLSA